MSLPESVMDRPRFRAVFFHPRFWLLWLGLGLLWLVTQLPYRALLTIGRLLGAGMYRVAGERRRIAARNLELCFPEKSAQARKHLLKENFASTGIAFFEMAMSWWWSRQRLARLAHVEGLQHLKQAQLDGKGVILMALHFTTLEIGAALLGQKHTIDGMYREHGNPLFDFIQRRGRERHNLDSLAVEREDVRGMLKLVRAGPGLRRQAKYLRAAVRYPGCHGDRHQQVRPSGQGAGGAVYSGAPGRRQRLPPGDPPAVD